MARLSAPPAPSLVEADDPVAALEAVEAIISTGVDDVGSPSISQIRSIIRELPQHIAARAYAQGDRARMDRFITASASLTRRSYAASINELDAPPF